MTLLQGFKKQGLPMVLQHKQLFKSWDLKLTHENTILVYKPKKPLGAQEGELTLPHL